jgi:hypothetical protein
MTATETATEIRDAWLDAAEQAIDEVENNFAEGYTQRDVARAALAAARPLMEEAIEARLRESLGKAIEATQYKDPATTFQSGYNMCVENASAIARGERP